MALILVCETSMTVYFDSSLSSPFFLSYGELSGSGTSREVLPLDLALAPEDSTGTL